MSAPTQPPEYKGEPLDGERGPGLGCFWIQISLLTFFLIFTPLTVTPPTEIWRVFLRGAQTGLKPLFILSVIYFSSKAGPATRRSPRRTVTPV